MKKAILLGSLLASGAGNQANAQQPFPTCSDSGTWSVLRCLYGIGVWCGTESISYDYTDTLCGRTWSVYDWPGFGGPNVAYIRNEGQRTLLRRTSDCLDKEYVVYDFSMEVGDSLYAPMTMDIMDPDTTLFVLQDIDTVDVLGVERRRFSLLYDPCNENFVNTPMQWIEGIGSTTYPFFPVECMCDFCEQSFGLLCYDSAGVQLYLDPFYGTCDTLITAIDERDRDGARLLQVKYDASAGALNIALDPGVAGAGGPGFWLTLVASDGRTVKRQQVPDPPIGPVHMEIAAIARGAYALLLSDDRALLAAQRIVIP